MYMYLDFPQTFANHNESATNVNSYGHIYSSAYFPHPAN